MSEQCRNDCTGARPFPRKLFNRPGLDHLDYRIGAYADFREALLRALNDDPVLADWTHREADDPGIALIEGVAILGDILTFYQELYANEAYLRTAQWRESVADLVKLLGYRLSPGVGGKASFAFEVKGEKPVAVPKGFPVKVQLEGMDKPTEFETWKETTVCPELGKFFLYGPSVPGVITCETNQFAIETATLHDRSMTLKKDDRLMLVVDPANPLTLHQIVIIEDTQEVLDRTEIKIKGHWMGVPDVHHQSLFAYKLGRSFRHFGHNGPPQLIRVHDGEPDTENVSFSRLVGRLPGDPVPAIPPGRYEPITLAAIPLDVVVNDIVEGSALLVRLQLSDHSAGAGEEHFFYRQVKKVFNAAITQGEISISSGFRSAVSGGTTVVELDHKVSHGELIHSDVRSIEAFEVIGKVLTLTGAYIGQQVGTTNTLIYFGTPEPYSKLDGRHLLLMTAKGAPEEVTATIDPPSVDSGGTKKARPLQIQALSGQFSLQDFLREQGPIVTVYGNLVEATQGKTEREAVLGNGDSREAFQTFKLPKAPLTHFRSEEETPPESPELEVFVSDRLWTRVSSFFGHGPREEIYIVREDKDGSSWVQFGDGKTGARLPSGYQNVVARYRTGIGAYGPLKEGTTVQAGARLDRLKKIYLPGAVAGGDEPETAENAREAAPGKVQSLGRLVSLGDFETEALAIPGVSKAAARWALYDRFPAVVVTVLMARGREREATEVQEILNKANRDRGPRRFPVIVLPGVRQYVYLTVTAGYAPAFRRELLEKSVKEALGVTGEEGNGIDGSRGLFSSQKRRFGQPEYASRIEGIVQNLQGVLWAHVAHLGFVAGEGEDPLTLREPEEPGNSGEVRYDPTRAEPPERVLLALHTAHFHLSLSEEAGAREVPPYE